MGISFDIASKMAKVIREFSIDGLALTLGKQDIYLNHEMLSGILNSNGFVERTDEGIILANYPLLEKEMSQSQGLSCKADFRKHQYITDALLFGGLGLVVESLDVSDYEGADYIYDLNESGTPDNLKGKFDLVFDGGTIEHVFHIPNVMDNIFKMLKVGGCVIHSSPSNNFVDHGYYQFSPMFFYDYYYANNYEILQCSFFRYSQDYDKEPWMFMDYTPGRLDSRPVGGLDDKLYGTWFVARKTEKSTSSVIPQQGAFKRSIKKLQERIIDKFLQMLINQVVDKKLILFGANDIANKILENEILYNKTDVVIDSFRTGEIKGKKIEKIDYLNQSEGQVILITSSNYATEIMELIKAHNFQQKFDIMQIDIECEKIRNTMRII